jgi:hypothetical protein
MSRAKNRWLLVCSAVAVLLAAAIFVCWYETVEPVDRFPISFLGTSNDPVLGLVASFSVTNESPRVIYFGICPAQVRSGDAWPALQIPASSGAVLALGQSKAFSVAAPVGAREWRVPVVWGYSPTGIQSFSGRVKHNVRLNWLRLRLGRRPTVDNSPELTVYASYSPAISK